MITFVQVGNSYQHHISAQDKLTINITNFFSQEMKPPVVDIDVIRSQVEIALGGRFEPKTSYFNMYMGIEESIMAITKRIAMEEGSVSDEKPVLLLVVEDLRLYNDVKKAIIKNRNLDVQDCIDRIFEIGLLLEPLMRDDNVENENKVTELAVERMVITIIDTVDLRIVDLNQKCNLKVRDAFKEVVDYSYKKTDISNIHVGAYTKEHVAEKASLLDSDLQSKKMSTHQRIAVRSAYSAFSSEFIRMSKGDFLDSKPTETVFNESEFFIAPSIQ